MRSIDPARVATQVLTRRFGGTPELQGPLLLLAHSAARIQQQPLEKIPSEDPDFRGWCHTSIETPRFARVLVWRHLDSYSIALFPDTPYIPKAVKIDEKNRSWAVTHPKDSKPAPAAITHANIWAPVKVLSYRDGRWGTDHEALGLPIQAGYLWVHPPDPRVAAYLKRINTPVNAAAQLLSGHWRLNGQPFVVRKELPILFYLNTAYCPDGLEELYWETQSELWHP